MKVNISLDDDLMQRLDEYADRNYMTRSGLISLAATQFLNQTDFALALKDLSVSFRQIAETGEVDPETLRKVEELEQVARLAHLG